MTKKTFLLLGGALVLTIGINACKPKIPASDTNNNQPIQQETNTPPSSDELPTKDSMEDSMEDKNGCIVTGCSGHVCSDKDVTTTCEYREEYACYKSAVCERQEDGMCGWTQTKTLQECIDTARDPKSERNQPDEEEVSAPPATDPIELEATFQFSGQKLAGNASPLIDFNKKDFEAALSSGKNIVLYYYASWCPTCRAEFPKMQAAFNELTRNDVVGFRINYNDSNTDDYEKKLSQEHGVLYQHTKIFIQNGSVIYKAPDSWEKQKYLDEIDSRF